MTWHDDLCTRLDDGLHEVLLRDVVLAADDLLHDPRQHHVAVQVEVQAVQLRTRGNTGLFTNIASLLVSTFVSCSDVARSAAPRSAMLRVMRVPPTMPRQDAAGRDHAGEAAGSSAHTLTF